MPIDGFSLVPIRLFLRDFNPLEKEKARRVYLRASMVELSGVEPLTS
jgi:hypothetical protein